MLCNGQFKPYRSVFNENKFTPNKKYYTKCSLATVEI